MRNAFNTENVWHESEALYQSLFESLQDIFSRTGHDGNILLVSPSIVLLLGCTQDEASALNLRDDLFAFPEQWPRS